MKKTYTAGYDNESDFYNGRTSESKKGDEAAIAKDMIDTNSDSEGYWDDTLNDIIAEIAAKGAEYDDNEIESILNAYNITDPELREDVLETFKQIREADKLADNNIDPINLDKVDAMADAHAQAMANEDNTPVTVTKEDKDSDGDTDKVTIEQDGNEDDLKFSDEDKEALTAAFNELDKNSEDHSSEEADKPHDEENSTNQIANHLANYRF